MKILLGLSLLGWLPSSGLAAQEDPSAVHRAGLTLVPTLGAAIGAGNGFLDLGLGSSVYIGRLELRIHIGGLAFAGGCAVADIVPGTGSASGRCADGEGGYYDASLGLRFPDQTRPAAAWIISAGTGQAEARELTTLGVTVGRDQPIGGRWLLRFEVFGRHLFDARYEATSDTPHLQFGIRFGLGGWVGLD